MTQGIKAGAHRRSIAMCTITFVALVTGALLSDLVGVYAQSEPPLDPAAWGDDHVGKRIPEYVTGGECLFCHRNDVGDNWQENRHNLAMDLIEQPSDPKLDPLRAHERLEAFVDDIQYVVGHTRMRRFLKRSDAYGQVAMLSTKYVPAHGDTAARLENDANPHWNDDIFAESCVGCHATAVDTEYKAFSTFAIDCFQCHGDVPAAHNSEPALALFAATSEAGPHVEMSICAQCHLRGGKSKSSGLPYPNQFVPGDNLFKDYRVDFSDEHIASLNPSDRHVYENVRGVVIYGKTEMTCISCHDVHDQSTRKHKVLKRLERHEYCASCHDDPNDYESVIEYEVHSETCRY